MAQPGIENEFTNLPISLERDVSRHAHPHEDVDGSDFAQFFMQSRDLMCVAGLDDGYFKRLNPAWTTSLGWSIEKLLGEPIIDFVHPDDRENTIVAIGKFSETGVALNHENRCRHSDGSYQWLKWNAWAHPNGQHFYAIAQNVTRRKRHERETFEIVDRERARLGRDMHDGLCQTLAGIAGLSATLSKKLAATNQSASQAHADEISQLLKSAIGDARDMAVGLDPVGIDSIGLDGALGTLAVNVRHLFRVSCHTVIDNYPANSDGQAETQLFRIAQEAINNAVTHGSADWILIQLVYRNNEGILSVEDNGRGLPDDHSHSKGMGLRTMAYRADHIQASLDVRQREAGGTTVICTFPLTTQKLENIGNDHNDN